MADKDEQEVSIDLNLNVKVDLDQVRNKARQEAAKSDDGVDGDEKMSPSMIKNRERLADYKKREEAGEKLSLAERGSKQGLEKAINFQDSKQAEERGQGAASGQTPSGPVAPNVGTGGDTAGGNVAPSVDPSLGLGATGPTRDTLQDTREKGGEETPAQRNKRANMEASRANDPGAAFRKDTNQRKQSQRRQRKKQPEPPKKDPNYPNPISTRRFIAFLIIAMGQDGIPAAFDLLTGFGWLVNDLMLPITWALYWWLIIRFSPKPLRTKFWLRSALMSAVGIIPIVGELLPEWIATSIGGYIMIRRYEAEQRAKQAMSSAQQQGASRQSSGAGSRAPATSSAT